MNQTLKYVLIGVLVFVVAFVVALPFFGVGSTAASWGTYGCPAYGHGFRGWGMGPRMMGGWGMSGAFGWLGGLMILRMWLLPLLILGLIVAGIVWVIRSQTKNSQQ